MVHPLCGFIALRDSLVINSCSAGFGFCPLILQILVFQHSAAKAAHTSGVYSVIKSSKPKHLDSYGIYLPRGDASLRPLPTFSLGFPGPSPTSHMYSLTTSHRFGQHLHQGFESQLCVCGGCGSLAASISSLLSTAFLALNFDLEHYYSVSCSVISNALCALDCSLPGSSVHRILQARILEWVAIFFSTSATIGAYKAFAC